MLHKNKLRIMELFFEEPSREFHIREISRLSGLPASSVQNYLKELLEEKLVCRNTNGIYPSYNANTANKLFKVYKLENMVLKLHSSGLIEYIEDSCHSSCIILFGSVRKGEYDKTSDIDLFVQSGRRSLDLDKFEKVLKHKVNLFFEENIGKLSDELLNNIINGIKLSGYLKLNERNDGLGKVQKGVHKRD